MSCHTYESVMPHIRMSHVPHVTHHVTHKNESCQRYVTHTYVFVPIWHPYHTTICVDIACVYVCMYIYITPLFACILIYIYIHEYITVWVNIICIYIYIYVYICIDIFYIYIYIYIYQNQILSSDTASDVCIQIRHQDQMCAMTHSYVCQDSFIRVPWLIHTCAMTHSYECHVSSKYGIKIKSHHHLREWIFPWCARKVKDSIWHHCHMCNRPSLFTPALSARSSPVRQFVCVSYCIHVYTHTLAWWPPTHSKWVLVCMLTNTQNQKKELNQKRERPKETERKCEGGGRWK